MSVWSAFEAIALVALVCLLPGTCSGDTIACDSPAFGLSPYTWKMTGSGPNARAEAPLPGAYFKTIVNGSATIGLVIDGVANVNCPPECMPIVEWSVDEAPFEKAQLKETGSLYTLPLASGLDAGKPHKVLLYMHATGLVPNRWKGTETHLRIAGLAVDKGGTPSACPKRPKLAMGFGDSITEGVGVDEKFTGWDKIGPNNARGSWFPFACAALGCEYGQLGSSGQGLKRTLEMPPLTQTWDHFDPNTSRLTNGKLIPEPDYVFCNMGTNDYADGGGWMDITAEYITWAKAVRAACPNAHIFCVVPASGIQRDVVGNVVDTLRKAGDKRVYLIDIKPLNETITVRAIPTNMCYDGVHPSLYGSGMFGASIATRAAELLGASGR